MQCVMARQLTPSYSSEMSVVGSDDEEVTRQFGDWDGFRVWGDPFDLMRAEIHETYLSARHGDFLLILEGL